MSVTSCFTSYVDMELFNFCNLFPLREIHVRDSTEMYARLNISQFRV